MKSTEKQIAWAKQIIEDKIAMAKAMAEKPAYWGGSLVDYPEMNLSAVIEMLNSMDDASEIINRRGESLVGMYIKHIGWVAPAIKANNSDDPFAL